MLKYHHPLSTDDEQLNLYHFGKDHLDGKLALVLEKSLSAADGTYDYLCYIDSDRMWISETALKEVEENENKKKNS